MRSKKSSRPVTQRQLRVGEMIKQALGIIFVRGEAKLPNLDTNNITVTETFTRLTLPGSGTCTLTLPAGTAGQVKTIFTAVAGGAACTITTTNVLPAVTTTLTDLGDSWTGWYDTTASKWQTISTVAAGVSS